MESQKVVQNLVDTLNSINNTLVWWVDNHEALAPLIAKLKVAGYDVELTLSGLEAKGTGGRETLLAGMKALYAEGYRPYRKPSAKETWYGTFFHKEGEESARSIWFNFSSNVCQRVQVGTEMREMPVYEIQCAGDASLEISDEEIK